MERNVGELLGLRFVHIEFKDLPGGVSPSHHGVSPPPKASGSASSSAAAPTGAALTVAARRVVQAQRPKVLPAPPPSLSRVLPRLSREPLQVRFFHVRPAGTWPDLQEG